MPAAQPTPARSPSAAVVVAAPTRESTPSSPPSAGSNDTGVPASDIGIYPDLTSQVHLGVAARLREGPSAVVSIAGDHGAKFMWVAGSAVAFAPVGSVATVQLPRSALSDVDGDSIPDGLDVLIGAKRAVAAAAPYHQTYRPLAYPGGDVPRDEGVCSDVIVRALRNAGYDLQALVHDDAAVAPRAYPAIAKLDPNIDHRRVRNLVTWFARHWVSLPTDPIDASSPWLPGDIVFLDTLPGPDPDHVGVVSDQETADGRPLIINSWTDGYRTSEMDVLSIAPVTHRFRAPSLVGDRTSYDALGAVLDRAGLQIAPEHRQALLVTTPLWSSSRGRLRRFEREDSGQWRSVGLEIPVRLGDRGLGRDKVEGDHRSPAGVFELGTSFGRNAHAPPGVTWPYRATDERDYWVDDPDSPLYNTWQRATEGETSWRSAEALTMYELAIVVRYNESPVRVGAGSAIFLHAWRESSSDPSGRSTRGSQTAPPTVGCTAMTQAALTRVLRWLRADRKPVIVQTADALTD